MPLNADFGRAAENPAIFLERERRKRASPFSIRLTEAERSRLRSEAKGVPLGTYVKAKLLGDPALRIRRTGMAVEDRQALGKALALLGRSRISSNLDQLAQAVDVGVLPVTPETDEELRAACAAVVALRHLLMNALGMKSAAPSAFAEASED